MPRSFLSGSFATCGVWVKLLGVGLVDAVVHAQSASLGNVGTSRWLSNLKTVSFVWVQEQLHPSPFRLVLKLHECVAVPCRFMLKQLTKTVSNLATPYFIWFLIHRFVL